MLCSAAGSSKARRLWKGPSSASGYSLGVGAEQLLADVDAPAAAAADVDGGVSETETVEDLEAMEDLLESAAAMAAAQDPVSALSRRVLHGRCHCHPTAKRCPDGCRSNAGGQASMGCLCNVGFESCYTAEAVFGGCNRAFN